MILNLPRSKGSVGPVLSLCQGAPDACPACHSLRLVAHSAWIILESRFSRRAQPHTFRVQDVICVFVCILASIVLFWSISPSALRFKVASTTPRPRHIVCGNLLPPVRRLSRRGLSQKLAMSILMLFLFRNAAQIRFWRQLFGTTAPVVESAILPLVASSPPRRAIWSRIPPFRPLRVVLLSSFARDAIFVHFCLVFMKFVNEIAHLCISNCTFQTVGRVWRVCMAEYGAKRTRYVGFSCQKVLVCLLNRFHQESGGL